MELGALQAFVEVADRGSFSEAADALFLTQPAVSKRVAHLEASLDTRLFDRIGRRISLTEAGLVLLPRARRLLNDAADMRRALSDMSGGIGGTLVMGTSHHVGLHRLPTPLRNFTRAHPDVHMDIRFMDSEAACHAVELGDLEVAIVTLPPDPLPQLRMQALWRDELTVMVNSDHPLADRRELNLEDLVQYPAVLPSHGTYTRAILEDRIRSSGLVLNVGMATNYLETLAMLVTAGLGWSLLPLTLLSPGMKALPVRGVALCRQLGAVTHEKRSLSRAAREMIAYCAGHTSPG